MSEIIDEPRVHLDHLIKRQSLRYTSSLKDEEADARGFPLGQEDRGLRYSDIANDRWFSFLRKPDFQRETNAWLPQDCVDFLDSVVNGRIIPSIILWQNKENGLIYILDGAHRLSVIRAWMKDDWGDRAGTYYERRDRELVKRIADTVRTLANMKIGAFTEYERAFNQFVVIGEQGGVQKNEMSAKHFSQALFYSSAMVKHHTLAIQWEHGDYESAEQSFLRINRKGQALDPWEATLIEYRHSSYARCIMCIANGGESGHYWPVPASSDELDDELNSLVSSFSEKAKYIYQCLFVPPFRLPIETLSVPLMVAPAYFQKHKYLLEIVPLLAERRIAINEQQQIEIMERDSKGSPTSIIRNAEALLSSMRAGLEHLISPTHSSTSLAIVPLFYWYNQKAQYVRGLFYGFVYWLISGSEEDIRNRKLVLSACREPFEYLLFNYKVEISTLQERGGAGLKGTPKIAGFFQDFIDVINSNIGLKPESEELATKLFDVLSKYTHLTARNKKAKSSRAYSKQDKTQLNHYALKVHRLLRD
jgi:Protein of unknown function DUF262